MARSSFLAALSLLALPVGATILPLRPLVRSVDNPTADIHVAAHVARQTRERGEVVLTFDDGPKPGLTERVLSALDAARVKAAFFVCGLHLTSRREGAASKRLVADIVRRGHLLGNHTLTHPHLSTLDDKGISREIDGNALLLRSAAGRWPTLLRPPFGDLPPAASELAVKRGVEIAMWTIDPRDFEETDPARVRDVVAAHLERFGGGVILLHDTHESGVAALPLVLDWLRERPRFRLVDATDHFGPDHVRPPGD